MKLSLLWISTQNIFKRRRLMMIASSMSFLLAQVPSGYAQEEGSEKKPQFTYGWEVEFDAGKNVKENEFATFPDRSGDQERVDISKVDTRQDKYPFLSPKGVIEHEGNIEITSRPFTSQEEAFEKLHLVKKTLNATKEAADEGDRTAVRSIHLHIRFDKDLVKDKVNQSEFNSWVARLSDAVYLFRLTEKDPVFSMRYSTLQSRLHPDYLNLKGTTKFISDDYWAENYGIQQAAYLGKGKQFNIEFRGFMTDTEALEKFSRQFTEKLQNPESISGYYNYQALTLHPTLSLSETLNHWLAQKGQKTFDDETLKGIERYIQMRVYGYEDYSFTNGRYYVSNNRILLPLVGFEFMPYVSAEQRQQMKDQKEIFLGKMADFFRGNDLKKLQKLTYESRNDIHEPFYRPFKNWARDTKLVDQLNQTLFTSYDTHPKHEAELFQDPDFIRFLVDRIHLKPAQAILNTVPKKQIEDFFKKKVLNNQDAQRMLEFLTTPETKELRATIFNFWQLQTKLVTQAPLELPELLTKFHQSNPNGFVSPEECESTWKRFHQLGITNSHTLIGHVDELNSHLVKHSTGKTAAFDEGMLQQVKSFYQQEVAEKMKFTRALEYLAERIHWSNADKKQFTELFRLIGITQYSQFKEKAPHLNDLIKSYNSKIILEKQKLKEFNSKEMKSIKRVVQGFDAIGVI